MSIALSIGPRVRKSPFFESARKAGMSSASIYNHMYMPTGYGNPAAEYDRLVNHVAMWDVGVERQVALKGPDALALDMPALRADSKNGLLRTLGPMESAIDIVKPSHCQPWRLPQAFQDNIHHPSQAGSVQAKKPRISSTNKSTLSAPQSRWVTRRICGSAAFTRMPRSCK